MKRVYNEQTMTFAFPDGSGMVTSEQMQERDLLLSKIEYIESLPDKNILLIAALKYQYLTFFDNK